MPSSDDFDDDIPVRFLGEKTRPSSPLSCEDDDAESEGYSEMPHPWIDPEPLLDAEAEEVDQVAHDQASYPRTPSAQLRQEW